MAARLAVGILLTCLSGAAPWLQAHPVLSGHWIFDQAKSAQPWYGRVVIARILGDDCVVSQTATALELSITSGGRKVTAVYSFTGESRNVSPGDIPVTSLTSWDGNKLVITSKSESIVNGQAVAVESTRVIWIDSVGDLIIERSGTPASEVLSSRSVYRRMSNKESAKNLLASAPMDLTRRSFLLSTTAGLAAARLHGYEPLTADAVIQRIKEHVGVPWRAETVDKIVAGAGTTAVKGIATTMMATFDVVKRAAAAGRNLVITHEPTFYSHQDTTDALKQDATYQAKDAFLREHDMVVFRFHDHWHAMRPDGIATGMTRELGWDKQADPSNPREFVFPGVRLDALVKDMQTKLGIRAMRVIGDPAMTVKRVAASWGYYTFAPPNIRLARPEIDVYVVGETREWETVEYVQDQIAAGQKKALIVMGHVVSEQSGMRYCADWLKTFVSEVPIEFVAALEPFWSPASTSL